MLIKSLPNFLFAEETLFCHAHNIKSILESLSFEECHLGHLQCSQIVATAFNASNLTSLLMEDLKHSNLSDLPITEDSIPAIAENLLKFSKPLPFEGLNPDDYNDDFIGAFLSNNREPVIRKSSLIEVQKDWENWHLKTAEFIYAYLKESHGRFNYLEKFKLNAQSPWFFEQIILKKPSKPINQDNLFLHTSIYNKLFLYPQLDKHYTEKLISEKCEYYLSPELVAYLQENEDILPHLYKNRINKKFGLVLNYDTQREAVNLNVLISWKMFNTDKYPKRIQASFKDDPMGLYTISPKYLQLHAPNLIRDFKDKYPLSIRVLNKHAELPPRVNELLQNQDIEFTEQDYKDSSAPSSSALAEYGCFKQLGSYPESFHSSPERLNWCEENAMSMPDSITTTHRFEKPLELYANIEGKKWHAYLELTITCVTKGEILFTANDDKFKISHNNLSTKIARNKKYHDYLTLRTYLKCEDPNEQPKLISMTENLKTSHMKMKGFKEMYSDDPLLGPLKNFIYKHWQFEVVLQHQSLMNFYNVSGIKTNHI